MPDIKLGSLFDGIGVFPLAASRCGIRPVWASEIEKAPIVIAGDTIIEKLEHGHGRRTTIQRIASQLLNALGAEIPCDLGCPAA